MSLSVVAMMSLKYANKRPGNVCPDAQLVGWEQGVSTVSYCYILRKYKPGMLGTIGDSNHASDVPKVQYASGARLQLRGQPIKGHTCGLVPIRP